MNRGVIFHHISRTDNCYSLVSCYELFESKVTLKLLHKFSCLCHIEDKCLTLISAFRHAVN